MHTLTEILSPSEASLHQEPTNKLALLSTLCSILLAPTLLPILFQRYQMSTSVYSAKKHFVYAGAISVALIFFVIVIAIGLKSLSQPVSAQKLLNNIIEQSTFRGFKGLFATGILSMILSTGSSYLNCGAVIISNDLISTSKNTKKKLLQARVASFFLGILAMLMAVKKYKFAELNDALVISGNLLAPPLLLACTGFKTSRKVVLMGILTSLLAAFFWPQTDFYKILTANSYFWDNRFIPLFVHLITLILGHFFFRKNISLERDQRQQLSSFRKTLERLCEKKKKESLAYLLYQKFPRCSSTRIFEALLLDRPVWHLTFICNFFELTSGYDKQLCIFLLWSTYCGFTIIWYPYDVFYMA